jgi:hypothetical protein
MSSQRLDLASRSIDLVAVVAKSSGDLATSAMELIRWLERERINNESFTFAMGLGQDFAQPNSKGAIALTQLEAVATRLYGLELVMPGALGRSILADVRLRWVATSEAVILKYHDLSYATSAFCDLFLARHIDQLASIRPVWMARIRPVVLKVVESIALHVFNLGGGIDPLPDCLQELPHHFLAPSTLAEAIHTIQNLTDTVRKTDGLEILVKMEHCAIDLLSWTYHHWDGKLSISKDNRYIFQEPMGEGSGILTIMITDCTKVADCHDPEHVGTVWIGTCQAPHSNVFQHHRMAFEGITDPSVSPDPVCRSALYEIQNPYVTLFLRLSRTEKIAAGRYAQQIVRSIIDLPVKPGRDAFCLELKVDDSADKRFKWWIARTPTLLQSNFGGDTIVRPLYVNADANEEDVDIESDTSGDAVQSILTLYPEVSDAMTLASQRCRCGCEGKLPRGGVDDGCLQAVMFAEVILMVGHSMAEAAGASDVSNLYGSESSQALIDATTTLLERIATAGLITWDTWFRLASVAVSGLLYNFGTVDSDTRADVGGELLCWVAGSMTIIPRWYCLDRNLDLEGSWAVRTLTGCVAGINTEQAVLETQRNNSAILPDDAFPEPQTLSDARDLGEPAQIEVLSCVLAHLDNMVYRIMTVTRTTESIRVIDPAQVYRGLMLAPRPHCSHSESEREIYPWTFDQVLQGWNGDKAPPGQLVHVALLENSVVGQNIAAGLAAGCCVLQSRTCCFGCLVDTAKDHGFVGICCHGDEEQMGPRKRLKLT